MSVSIRPAIRSGRAPAAPPAALAPLALAAALLIAGTCAAYRLSVEGFSGMSETGPAATLTTPAVAAPAAKTASAITIPVREAGAPGDRAGHAAAHAPRS